MKKKPRAPAPRRADPVALVDPSRIPSLLDKVQRPPAARPGTVARQKKRWYVVTMPLAHRRAGSERSGWVLALAANESDALEMARDPALAPGMKRDLIAAVRPASPADIRQLERLPAKRLARKSVWTCWEIAGTTAGDY